MCLVIYVFLEGLKCVMYVVLDGSLHCEVNDFIYACLLIHFTVFLKLAQRWFSHRFTPKYMVWVISFTFANFTKLDLIPFTYIYTHTHMHLWHNYSMISLIHGAHTKNNWIPSYTHTNQCIGYFIQCWGVVGGFPTQFYYFCLIHRFLLLVNFIFF